MKITIECENDADAARMPKITEIEDGVPVVKQSRTLSVSGVREIVLGAMGKNAMILPIGDRKTLKGLTRMIDEHLDEQWEMFKIAALRGELPEQQASKIAVPNLRFVAPKNGRDG